MPFFAARALPSRATGVEVPSSGVWADAGQAPAANDAAAARVPAKTRKFATDRR